MPPDPEASPPLPPDMLSRALESALAADTPETAGSHIGPYKLLQEIGEGGFGTVWMAEQQEPIRRRVALKIIKLGMDTREVIARFEAERQALALMDHPNIARVFDAGSTDTGRPYFAMELVRGVPITRYCDENRLSPEARLRLFITVCQAVQHAHHKGVVHRDLKPSNILVTLHDGVPVPKVIDFGIAKATSAHLTDKTLFTQFHAFIGTPAYTSPEQMEMSGLDVDTRSDIYSLGVLLYELLTGRPPFDPNALAKSGLDAMRRTIREVDPPRPSARLGTLSDADRTSVAQQRGTDSGKLSVLLRGDLDWIVMHCLEKDRTRRYETANALATDVHRHLASEPVSARPPSGTYRLRKFVRRHKVGIFAAAAVAVSLVVGLIVSSVLLVRERAAHARAVVSERAEAELRRQAEATQKIETIRASRTARDLAGQLLAQDRTAEGLAWLVHAARKDPRDATIAPWLASVLTSRRFLVPEAAPLDLDSRVHTTHYSADGRRTFILCEDGTMAVVNATTGHVLRDMLPSPPRSQGCIAVHQGLVGILCHDGVVRVIDQNTAQVVREIRFEKRGVMAWANDSGVAGWFAPKTFVGKKPGPVMIVALEDQSVAIVDITTTRTSTPPTGMSEGRWVDTIDGRWLIASRAPFRELEVWDATTGEKLRTLSFAPMLVGAAISPDGRRLATLAVSAEMPTVAIALKFWSFPDLQPLTEPQSVENMTYTGINGVRFSPDGRWVLAESPQGKQVFDASTGEKIGAYISAGLGSAFSADSRQVIARVAEGIQFFDVTTGLAVSSLLSHRGGNIRACEFNDDGRVMLTTSLDGFARLWDVKTGQLLTEPTLQQTVAPEASISPDGTHLIIGTAGGTVYRLRVGGAVARPLSLPRNRAGATPAPFLADAPARLLWFHRDCAKVIDAASGRELAGGFGYPEPIVGADAGNRGIAVRSDLSAMVVQTVTGKWQAWELGPSGITRVVSLEDPPNGGGWIQLSPAGDLIAIVANDSQRQVRFWDLHTGKLVGRPRTHDAPINTHNNKPGAFSPDGRSFAAGCTSGIVKVWDVTTGATTLELGPMRDSNVRIVNYSPDGTRIVTANNWGEARLWDAKTGKPASAVLSHGAAMQTADFSGDGKFLLTSSGSVGVHVWSAHDGSPVGPRLPVETSVRFAQFSADATRVVTASSGTSVGVWDMQSGQVLVEPMEHPARLYAAIFSPDGRFIRSETVNTPSSFTAYWLWSVPPPLPAGATTPEWLLELATICATKVIDHAGQCVDEPDALTRIDDVRRQLAALPVDAPYAEWGRWVLDDRPDRPIAPGFSITSAEADTLATAVKGPAP